MDHHEVGMGMAVRSLVAYLRGYAEQYHNLFEQQIAEDAVIGQSWITALKAVQELLNGPLGYEDAGLLDSEILDAATRCGGFTEEQVWS